MSHDPDETRMRGARAATEPDEAVVARLAEGSAGLGAIARAATTPDEAEVLRVVAAARRAPARTGRGYGWLLGLGMAGAAFAGAAWWAGPPAVEAPPEIARAAPAPAGPRIERVTEPVVVAAVDAPSEPRTPRRAVADPAAPPPAEPAPIAPLEAEPPRVSTPAAPPPNADAKALAALLARVEAGEPPRQVLAAVEAWTATAADGPLRDEGEVLGIQLSARVRPAARVAKAAATWASEHPTHPRAGETWLLAGDLSERARACAEARAAWTRAAEASASLGPAVAERLEATPCR